jgi:hypothetical protein
MHIEKSRSVALFFAGRKEDSGGALIQTRGAIQKPVETGGIGWKIMCLEHFISGAEIEELSARGAGRMKKEVPEPAVEKGTKRNKFSVIRGIPIKSDWLPTFGAQKPEGLLPEVFQPGVREGGKGIAGEEIIVPLDKEEKVLESTAGLRDHLAHEKACEGFPLVQNDKGTFFVYRRIAQAVRKCDLQSKRMCSTVKIGNQRLLKQILLHAAILSGGCRFSKKYERVFPYFLRKIAFFMVQVNDGIRSGCGC